MAKLRHRARYSEEFKIQVVKYSLSLPPTARVKPTCRAYPGIEPVQIRKWIKAFAPLIHKWPLLEHEVQFPTGADGSDNSDESSSKDAPSPSDLQVGQETSSSMGPVVLSRQSTEPSQSSLASGHASPLFNSWPAGWAAPPQLAFEARGSPHPAGAPIMLQLTPHNASAMHAHAFRR